VIEASPSGSFDPGFYETLIRSGVRQALANNQATSKGDYGIRLSLWIAPTGKISRLQILRSSGDAARDKAAILALQDLMLEAPPPPRLLQPVALDIQAKTKK
jgi:TonB family protein